MTRKKVSKNENPDILTKAIDTLVPDLMKKSFLIGMGCLVLTEEALRKMLSDYKLPGEVISGIVQQSYKTRDEMIRVFREELRSYADKVRVDRELKKLMQHLKINIQMEVNFEVKEKENGSISVRPKLSTKTKKTPPSNRKR